jgi:hypothetical protein
MLSGKNPRGRRKKHLGDQAEKLKYKIFDKCYLHGLYLKKRASVIDEWT